MTVTDELVARGASRIALSGARFEQALWAVSEGGFFRVTLEETPHAARMKGVPPSFRRHVLVTQTGHQHGVNLVGTFRTMRRCGLVRRRRDKDPDEWPRHFIVTERGERMAAERRADARYPWWMDIGDPVADMDKREAVEAWLGETPCPGPLDPVGLRDALYTHDELGLWPDDVTVSREQAVRCWRVVEACRARGFPDKLRM